MPEFPKGASEMRSSPSFFPFALSDRAEARGESKVKHLKVKICLYAMISQRRTSPVSSMRFQIHHLRESQLARHSLCPQSRYSLEGSQIRDIYMSWLCPPLCRK